MQREKFGQQLLGRQNFWIVAYGDNLCVAGILGADIVVTWAIGMSAGEAHLGTDDPGQLPKVVLPAPEAAAAEQQFPSGFVRIERAVLSLVLLAGYELDRQTIHAMTRVLLRKPLAVEDVPEVAAAVIT